MEEMQAAIQTAAFKQLAWQISMLLCKLVAQCFPVSTDGLDGVRAQFSPFLSVTQRAHITSTRRMPYSLSSSMWTLSGETGSKKLGQPVPDSNFLP